ncbi:MAG: hypothetical protein LBF70_02530 [Holosporales bacterium]|jgi:type II secretory pathway pseudopilin PulG|nr:hypothetical protein [Holosporales bacterium]
MKIKRNNKTLKGITLIEVSIVLLITGILAISIMGLGFEMFASAKKEATIRYLENLKIACAAFENKFGTLPGDGNTKKIIQALHDAKLIDSNAQVLPSGEEFEYIINERQINLVFYISSEEKANEIIKKMPGKADKEDEKFKITISIN